MKLFAPLKTDALALPNRVVMAPMTRSRTVSGIPDNETALYYAQRASAGLIVSEGAPVSGEGVGYLYTPGLNTDAQEAGWTHVTRAVHERGGHIFAQLWHVGRVSHVSLQPDGAAPVSASALRAQGTHSFAFGPDGAPGQQPASLPRALETEEVTRVTHDFVEAAKRAMRAGFDGVEIHGANGYLFEQFINAGSNLRTDRYGGSVANRLRFLLETVDAVSDEIGAARVGVRISPYGRQFDLSAFEDESETWLTLAHELNVRGPAYVHLSEHLALKSDTIPEGFAARMRTAFTVPLIAAGGFTRETAEHALRDGALDLVAFGRPYIANPDLVERMKNDWPLAEAPREAFYGGSGSHNYTDFPNWQPPQPVG